MKLLTAILIVTLVTMTLPYPSAWAGPDTDTQLDELLARYPNARVCRVTPAEFRRIAPHLQAAQGAIVLAQTVQQAGATPIAQSPVVRSLTNAVISNIVIVSNKTPAAVTNQAPTNAVDTNRTPKATTVTNQTPLRAAPHAATACDPIPAPHPVRTREGYQSCVGFFDVMGEIGSGAWCDSDGAVVIFIIIGVATVVAVVVYAGLFLYEVASGGGRYDYWWDVQFRTTALTDGGDRGYIAGLKVSSGFENRKARVGLVLEGGYLDALIRSDDAEIALVGGFMMAGAGVRWPFGRSTFNPSFFGLELLAGTSGDEDVKLMSAARANVSFGVGARTRLGLSLGALYLGLDAGDGLIKDIDNFTTLAGIETGYRF